MNRHILGISALSIASLLLAAFVQRSRAGGIPDVQPLTYSGWLESEDGSALGGEHRVSVGSGTRIRPAVCCARARSRRDRGRGPLLDQLPDACTAAISGEEYVWSALRLDGDPLPRATIGAVPFSVEAKHAESSSLAARAAEATGALQARIAALEASLSATESANRGVVNGRWSEGSPTNFDPSASEGA